ncbi:MAG: hypothetical protein B6D64_12960 [Bacteroidetes bacterium 4484_276]|nr:MAG: hypothetical protein B6D64_12960 [Bacteroidetes bacterium 4484_276]
MTAPGSITYLPDCDNVTYEKPVTFVNITPWNDVHHTPGTHIVAFAAETITTFATGDIIGAFTQTGLCAGMVAFTENGAGLVLSGDDIHTTSTDGFVSDELISYGLFRPSTGETFDLKVDYDPNLDNSGLFHFNSMSAITNVKMSAISVSEIYEGSIHIYPNPSPGIFNIEGVAGKAEITIFNAFGEEVLYKDMASPGQVDLTGQPKGIYFIRITTEKGMHFEKLVVN